MVLRRLIHTSDDHTLTVVRLMLGVVFLAHGAQKALGWFGGGGFNATLSGFTRMGIPEFFAVLAILAEFLGGIGLIVGLLTRVAAFGIAVNMCVAIALVHVSNGLFMNWQGTQRGEGFEFHLLVLAIAVELMVRGAGAWSIDHAIDASRPYHTRMQPA
ncbi:MAG TPA: DoxX family protein [Candidatus Solibacter sp.]|nr:DoxX family protein [Candidatus Solibacter sp.]